MPKSFLVAVTNDLNQDQRMHRICDSLIMEGHTVMLLGREKPNSSPLLNQSFDQRRLKCMFSKGFLFYLEYNIRVLFFALGLKTDIIYAVDLDTLMGCGVAARFTKKKLIHDAHEYFVEVPELEGKVLKKRLWNIIGLKVIPKCDLCFSVNEELSAILTEKYKNKFHVIRSVPLLSSEKKVICGPNKRPVILYQGVLNKGRGLEESILAINDLNMDVEFRIAGEGDISSDLRALVKKLGAENKVKFLGWLTPMELKEATIHADIGLNLLSAKSLNYKYSLANKFFDYMHAGVPSINMDFPVYKRICNQYDVGVCIDSLESDSIQESILSLLKDVDRMAMIKKECDRAKMEYNWKKESSVLIDLINKYT